MAYEIRWRLWDLPLPESALRVWQKDRVRAAAEAIVDRRSEAHPTLFGHITPLLGQELRDWVLRGGEKFMPLPDHVLDAYWRAHRGLPGFYDPLLLGLEAKRYLALGGSGEIGEGVAMCVIETPAPDGLGYHALFRPLGTSPDFICQDPSNDDMRPLVEVKTTELGAEARKGLVDGVQTLLDVYRAWQRHRPLQLTPGLAVAVHLGQTGFDVEIIRLRFAGRDLVERRREPRIDTTHLETAKKAVWAALYDEAARALDQLLANQPEEVLENEFAQLLEVRRVSVSAMAVRDSDFVDQLPRSKKLKDAQHKRREAIRRLIEDHGIRFDADAVKGAEELAEEVHQLRLEEKVRTKVAPAAVWFREGELGDWRYIVQPRADGVELRSFRIGRGRSALTIIQGALGALEAEGGGRRRYRQGHGAVAAWIDGVEWAAFADGRIQGWIPEVEDVPTSGDELVRAVERVIWAWEAPALRE